MLADKAEIGKFGEVVSSIPIEHLDVCIEIINYATNVLGKRISSSIYISLTDHINFALERHKTGVVFDNPLAQEIKNFYRSEYLVGEYAVAMIEKKLGIELPVDEAASIAMHFINAEYNTAMSDTMHITTLIREIIELVEKELRVKMDDTDISYGRFVAHLKFLAFRVFNDTQIVEQDEEYNNMVIRLYPKSFSLVEKIASYMKDKYNYNIGLSDQSKVLVIPVDFTNHPADNNMLNNLELAFFGNSEDTGWESLKSYYYKSSYGKVNISGTVLPVFHTNKTSGYYERIDEDSAVNSIIKSALEYYDNSINYDDYDTDLDGYIDSIYIIYTAPVDYYGDSLYWAFSYEYFTDDYEYYDGVEADFYSFMGYDFFFDELANESKIKLNTETLIHESGHLFGLDDYYDYNQSIGPDGGIGGGDMMDYNVGDHNPFSKLLMGWVTPYVVCDTSDITLNSFGKSGECILLVDEYSSIYDEYYLIDFYTPDGLNELEAGNNGLFSISGIRIYHIDARITKNDAESILDIYDYDNSYTNHRLISLVQTSGKNTIEQGEFSSNQDLLKYNQEYTISSWYSNTNIKFVISAVLNEDLTVDVKIIKK